MQKSLLAVGVVLCGLTVGQSRAADSKTAVEKAPAPELVGVGDWINSKPLKMADLKGKVVVVHFFTFGCINCVHNYPHYRKWSDSFEGKDVVILGIHTPEFEREKKLANIQDALKESKLAFPVAVDNDAANWKAWKNRYWPCVYLVDKQGQIRHRWEGELGRDGEAAMRGEIEALLKEGK